MELFQIICNIIISIGAVTVAIVNIYNFFAKPTSYFKKRSIEHMKEALENVLPEYLLQHDLETRKKYLSDREKYLHDISDEVLDSTTSILEEIKEINLKQTESIDNIVKGLRDILRYEIMDIYHKYRKVKKIPISDKEKLDESYNNYKHLCGNNYIDKYYARMTKWEIIYDEEFEDMEEEI